MKRFVALLLKAVIGFGLVFIAYELLIWVHAPALAWGVSAAGRNPDCGALEGYRGLVDQERQRSVIQPLADRCKLLKKDGNLHLYATPHGEFWIPSGSDSVLPKLIAQQEAKIYGSVRPGDTVIDCGAHVGTFARQALKGGAKLVLAVEPAPDNVECLRRAFRADIEAGRMIVVAKGVWNKEDSLPFYADPDNSAADSFVIRGSTDKVIASIPLTTIDRIVEEYKLDKVDLIKMDIKGATVNALEGAQETVRRHLPRIVISTEEEADAPRQVAAAISKLSTSYQPRCGICSVTGALTLNPDVVFFDLR